MEWKELQNLFNAEIARNATLSLLWLVGVLVLRFFIIRAILRREALSPESRRRWLVNTRNALLLVFVAVLISIWAQELRTLAFSVLAFAVAFAIATKELILCFLGGVLRAGARSYAVGDRIEINNVKGDVIDQNFLTTTVLEIGAGQSGYQYTGRGIVIPNSVLLTMPLFNETFMEGYVPHVLSIPLTVQDDWKKAEKALLEAARAECSGFLAEAGGGMKRFERRHGLVLPPAEPRVILQLPEPGIIQLSVAVPVPARSRGQVEQAILRRFLADFHLAGLPEASLGFNRSGGPN